jgi:hypothetical protein
MPSDTRTLLGPNAAECRSRSLFLDRFSDPSAKDSGDRHPRRDWFNSLRGKLVWPGASEKLQAGALTALQRVSLRPSQALWNEFLQWDDKQVRKAAAAFAFASFSPKTGRESTNEYRFTLANVLEQRTALFLAQKNHAGSDFAKGVKRLAEEFQLPLP